MLEKVENMLEKLGKLFPQQDYQTRLERYIVSRYPASIGDIEHHEREFDRQQQRGFL